MPALVVALVIAITAASGGGAAYASQGALPGQALYPVKTAIEQIQTTFAFGDEAKAQAHIALATKRLAEIEKALQKQDTVASDAAAEAFAKEVADADQHFATAAGAGKDVVKLAGRLEDSLTRHEKVLAKIGGQAPAQARDALARAAAAAEKGLKNAGARVQGESEEKAGDGANTQRGKDAARPTATTTGQLPSTTHDITGTISVALSITLTQAISDVQRLADDRNISGQSYEGLLAKLHAAREATGRGQSEVAVRVLDAFLNELNAFHSAGHISAENYNSLYASYAKLVNSLGGSPKAQAGAQSPHSEGKPEPTATATSGQQESTTPPRGRR